ncbi:carph-isopro domain-containing protein [Brevundimonas sp.]|uniref:carph-isopro domain-containing protein n=1 Tax=Brevundimonas sp. TaxID=1871086 RepID=UPI003917EDB3
MDNCRTNESPAQKAIRLLGVKAIAWECDLTTDAVYKWPKLREGRIPSKHQPAVLALASRRGVPLTPAELIGVAA